MWGALIGAGASLLGGAMGSSSAKKAAKQQEALAREGLAAQREMYDIGREDLAPYRSTGEAANARLSYLLGIEGGNPAVAEAQRAYDNALARQSSSSSMGAPDGWRFDPSGTGVMADDGIHNKGGYRRLNDEGMTEWMDPQLAGLYAGGGFGGRSNSAEVDAALNALNAAKSQSYTPGPEFGSLMERFHGQDLYDDPGYQFRLNEGMKAMGNSAAARGMQLSGAQMKGLGRYGQDYASNEFNNARNRFIGDQDQTVNYLTGATQRGQNAANASAGMAQNFGAQQANTMQGIGNAQSAGTVASGNAWQSGLNGAYNAYQDSQQGQRLNALLRGSTTPYNSGGGYLTSFSR